jgi:glycosyltransferase involved in cell wall biosynthesis
MPAGIDTSIFFNKNIEREKNSILCIGRISTIKNVDILIDAIKILDKQNLDFHVYIYGNSIETDIKYFEKVKSDSDDLIKTGRIKFFDEVSNYKTPEIYNKCEIYVNMTNSGSLDKTVLEAMACGCISIVSNESYRKVLDDKFIFQERNVESFVESIKNAFNLVDFERDNYIKLNELYVRQNHSLNILVNNIFNILK